MNRTFERPFWPTEKQIAALLGLTIPEYRQLSHSGLREMTGLDGKPLYYFLTVSPLNPQHLLDKLQTRMDRRRMICFPPDIVAAPDLQAGAVA